MSVREQRTSERMSAVDEPLWAIADVARFLSVSEKSGHRLAQTGRIPDFKEGPVWGFREAEIRISASAKKEATRSTSRRAT